jgi:hypothetical protein
MILASPICTRHGSTKCLSRGLELDEDGRGDVLKRKDWCAAHLTVALPEHGVSLSPDFAVVGNGDTSR